MLSQAHRAKTDGRFFFTTFDQINPDTIPQSPIWRRTDRENSVPPVFLDTRESPSPTLSPPQSRA